MLSLLSLIIASGTVLRADTELWEPLTYPDPRTNSTECNVPHDGTLCDPDHILTDTWRQTILDNIEQHMAKLEDAKIPYTENASPECLSNSTGPVQIFLILAKRIHAASNQSITTNDLTQFGHGIREAFGLDTMTCKNYVLVLGVELSKQVYVWTGSDLAIPKETLDNSLDQFKNLFTERNYMEGLNKIVDEISSLIMDPYKSYSTTEAPEESTEDTSGTTLETSSPSGLTETVIPTWMYVVIAICIVITVLIVIFFALFIVKYLRSRSKSAQIYPIESNQKSGGPIFNVIQKHDSNGNENYQLERSIIMNRRPSIDSENSHQPMSEHNECTADASSIISVENVQEDDSPQNCFENIQPDNFNNPGKVALDDGHLSTDRVIARRNSDTRLAPPSIEDQFSSL
uniref:TPM_phosphatase domain-containing protein n=1 Tax=Caenorhabditis tropicalis TaxID=1561998 RepID=A0A1I7TJH8_9PELO